LLSSDCSILADNHSLPDHRGVGLVRLLVAGVGVGVLGLAAVLAVGAELLAMLAPFVAAVFFALLVTVLALLVAVFALLVAMLLALLALAARDALLALAFSFGRAFVDNGDVDNSVAGAVGRVTDTARGQGGGRDGNRRGSPRRGGLGVGERTPGRCRGQSPDTSCQCSTDGNDRGLHGWKSVEKTID
jgi:hypothetical protein